MLDKVEAHKKEFEKLHLNSMDAEVRMRNSPDKGPLKDKWTGEQFNCPVCGTRGLDKFTGGPDIQDGQIRRTDFIYHCRVCDLNLTEEEYQQI